MVLEGQKKKAADEDINKTTVMMERRTLKAENETSAMVPWLSTTVTSKTH